jgi:hypothetical protein
MTATIRRTLSFITLSATRALSLFLAFFQSGIGFNMLPGIALVS